MNLSDLKTEVNFINQNATRKSFEILIALLEKTGFATALMDAEMSTEMSEKFAEKMADVPADQPKMEQEDKDAQMQDGEEIPDADIVEQTEVTMEVTGDEQETPEPDGEWRPGTDGQNSEKADSATDDAPEKMLITADETGELDVTAFDEPAPVEAGPGGSVLNKPDHE